MAYTYSPSDCPPNYEFTSSGGRTKLVHVPADATYDQVCELITAIIDELFPADDDHIVCDSRVTKVTRPDGQVFYSVATMCGDPMYSAFLGPSGMLLPYSGGGTPPE
jgi:hypothetical protein